MIHEYSVHDLAEDLLTCLIKLCYYKNTETGKYSWCPDHHHDTQSCKDCENANQLIWRAEAMGYCPKEDV